MDAYLGGNAEPIQSNYNRLLPTHQCYATFAARQFYGTLAASHHDPGFLSTGVQDSGNIYCARFPAPDPWRHIDFGDGGWNGFLSDGTLLRGTVADAVTAALSDFGPNLKNIGLIPVGLPPTDPAGIHTAAADVVRQPRYRKHAALLTAVAGVGNQLYGCYGDSSVEFPNSYHWDPIATLPSEVVISAVGSYDGGTILVGASGRMFVVDTSLGGVLIETPVVLPSPAPGRRMQAGGIYRVVAMSATEAYVMMSGASATWKSPLGATTTVTAAYVLQLDALQWVVTAGAGLPNEPLFGLEVVAEPETRVPHALFVSTDDRVYVSRDKGSSWQQASQGLPRNPHCADLRFGSMSVIQNPGAWVCLSTFGRSVYLARVR